MFCTTECIQEKKNGNSLAAKWLSKHHTCGVLWKKPNRTEHSLYFTGCDVSLKVGFYLVVFSFYIVDVPQLVLVNINIGWRKEKACHISTRTLACIFSNNILNNHELFMCFIYWIN